MTECLSAAFVALRRRAVLIFLAVLPVLAACATQPQPPAEMAYRASLLWQVEKPGFARSYVFGTVHSADPRLRDLPPEVREAFDASASAAFEINGTAKDEADFVQALQQPQGQRLEDTLGADLFQRTAAAVSRFGLQPEAVQRMTPLALLPLLIYPAQELAWMARGEKVLDDWLRTEARRQSKSLHGLESYREHLALFTDASESEQAVLISDMLADHAQLDALWERTLEVYLAGDAAAIHAESNDLSGTTDPEAAEAFRQRLIDDRNRLMVERMLPLMAKEATFVAVGAAHLPGERGILRLLEQRGFTVTRLH